MSTFKGCSYLIPIAMALLIATSVGVAQQGQISAFTFCIDENESSYLCAQDAYDLAEGWSATEPGGSAVLGSRTFTIYTGQEACETAFAPSSIEIGLFNPNLQEGDRIYLQDIIIEAFDADDRFIPRVPIIVRLMHQDRTMRSQSDWDYVEVTGTGSATFLAHFYCEEEAIPLGSLSITVTP